MKRGRFFKVMVVSIIVCFSAAFIGSIFTTGAVKSDWYRSIKPSFTPPDYLFGPVWTILYFLISLSLTFLWIKTEDKRKLILVFGSNLLLNALWSIIYFGLKNPLIAFIELIGLWISIVVMIAYSWKIDRRASYMLMPYLLWVSFAGVLNFFSI